MLADDRSFALIGLPGGGKSTIGRNLARQLGRRFIDSDIEIERRIGCSIRTYFEREGEPKFRDVEQEVIADVSLLPRIILATGGGTVIREANRVALKERVTVIYLRSTPEEIFRRLRHDLNRPLLQVKDPLVRLRDLYRDRDPLYKETAHFSIDTGRPSVPALVNMILMQLELAGLLDPSQVPSTVDPTEPSA